MSDLFPPIVRPLQTQPDRRLTRVLSVRRMLAEFIWTAGSIQPRDIGQSVFFCNDTAPPEIYTLSLHDALPIPRSRKRRDPCPPERGRRARLRVARRPPDRKSTRLNSSHMSISYAVFCLQK